MSWRSFVLELFAGGVIFGLGLFGSCSEETALQTIPYAPVNFSIDPQGFDHELNDMNAYKVFTVKSHLPLLSSDRFGFGGVLVVTDANGGLHAYDLCCPHEDRKLVVVDPVYEDGATYNGKARCPSCGSVFVTMFGIGNVESGPSTEPLQRYSVISLQDGSFRIVN